MSQGLESEPATAASERSVRLAGWLLRARQGETGALEVLVRELNPLLWHVARVQGLDAQEAADVVQTSWLELWRQLHDLREPRALTAWLVTITRREAARVRGGRRAVTTDRDAELETLSDPAVTAEDRIAESEQHEILWRNFRRLSQRCRDLLRIVARVDRPDYDAVAQAIGMPRGSIGPTRGRCLGKLRALLLDDPAWSR